MTVILITSSSSPSFCHRNQLHLQQQCSSFTAPSKKPHPSSSTFISSPSFSLDNNHLLNTLPISHRSVCQLLCYLTFITTISLYHHQSASSFILISNTTTTLYSSLYLSPISPQSHRHTFLPFILPAASTSPTLTM
jgi:hypothetical protein